MKLLCMSEKTVKTEVTPEAAPAREFEFRGHTYTIKPEPDALFGFKYALLREEVPPSSLTSYSRCWLGYGDTPLNAAIDALLKGLCYDR